MKMENMRKLKKTKKIEINVKYYFKKVIVKKILQNEDGLDVSVEDIETIEVEVEPTEDEINEEIVKIQLLNREKEATPEDEIKPQEIEEEGMNSFKKFIMENLLGENNLLKNGEKPK